MPEVLPPDGDRQRKAPQRRGKYPWGDWLAPGAHLMFHKDRGPWGKADFPGTDVVHFRQACYNAAARMRLSVSASVIDPQTLEVWVFGKEE